LDDVLDNDLVERQDGHRHALLGLLQDRGDLLDGKALLLRGTSSWPARADCAAESLYEWSDFVGPLTQGSQAVIGSVEVGQ
jgi:hypothetical protein